MKVIGILCAVERELAPYLDIIQCHKASSGAMLTFHEGMIDGTRVVAVYSGVCRVNAAIATQLLIDRYNACAVIVSGTAGGIDKRLEIGDSVIVTEACYHDIAEGILTSHHPYMSDICFMSDKALLAKCRENISAANGAKIYYGRTVTGEAFIDTEGRERIISEFAPLCVDMETAAVAHACYVNRLPFIAVRSISDTADENGEATFDKYCAYAAAQSCNVVRQLLPHI